MTDPWLPPAAPTHGPRPSGPQPYAPQPYAPQPYAVQPYAPQPYAVQPYAPSSYAPPSQAAPAGVSRTAVAALVVAVLALLGVIGLALTGAASSGLGGALAAAADMSDGDYELQGTLPQAAPGRSYSAAEVRTEVERVLDADWSTYEGIECEPLAAFAVSARTECAGIVDDYDTELVIEVSDDLGYFTLTQYW